MAFIDWDFYQPVGIHFVDVGNPIVGAGSLRFQHFNSTSLANGNAVPKLLSPLPFGFGKGKLRSIFQVFQSDFSNAGTLSYFGLACMQSDRDLVNTVGSDFYYAAIEVSETFVANLLLGKVTSGFSGFPGTPFVSIPYPDVLSEGSIHTLEIQWIADIPNLGGTHLLCRTGTLTDYSDLTDQIVYFDSSSPLSSTVSEGLIISLDNSSAVSNQGKVILTDQTTLYELT